jgi:aryl-alcohol dehydrogenase-like predicted oxidoreductase
MYEGNFLTPMWCWVCSSEAILFTLCRLEIGDWLKKMNDDFIYRDVPAFGRRVCRLGLAVNYGIDGSDLEWALTQGVNYIFWTPRAKRTTPALKAALQRSRESVVLATGPTTGFFPGGIRRACERVLESLGTDYIDIFQLFWLGRASLWRPSTARALASLRDAGMVRAIGVSIHDRVRAGRLAADSPLDMLMIRYNAAHTGAEQDIFPRTAGRRPAFVAYTATRWGGLLKRPKGWEGPVMTAADCYRFCLSNPQVDLVLTGPKTRQELEDNIRGVSGKGPLSDDENRWIRAYGQAVHDASSRFTFGF